MRRRSRRRFRRHRIIGLYLVIWRTVITSATAAGRRRRRLAIRVVDPLRDFGGNRRSSSALAHQYIDRKRSLNLFAALGRPPNYIPNSSRLHAMTWRIYK